MSDLRPEVPKGCELWAMLGCELLPQLDMGKGPGGTAGEDWGLKGDRTSSRGLAVRHSCLREGTGSPAGPEPEWHLGEAHQGPFLLGGLGCRQSQGSRQQCGARKWDQRLKGA